MFKVAFTILVIIKVPDALRIAQRIHGKFIINIKQS